MAVSVILTFEALAFTPEADAGKEQFAVCNACHNPALEPPLAPPMWGIQRRYKMLAESKDQFIDLVAAFAAAPSQEKAIFTQAVENLGLMPPVALPDEQLRGIAAYIWEEQFAPPCAHWQYGAARAEKAGDIAHAQKDRRMMERFCSQ